MNPNDWKAVINLALPVNLCCRADLTFNQKEKNVTYEAGPVVSQISKQS